MDQVSFADLAAIATDVDGADAIALARHAEYVFMPTSLSGHRESIFAWARALIQR